MPRVNWKQAGVEASLLLIGVLLALLAQAWWEVQNERETINEYAANLQIEITANQEELRKGIQRHEGYIDAGTALIEGMQEPLNPESSPGIKEQITILGYIGDFRPATSSLENLVGTGGLGLLESTELQLAISNYARGIDDHNVVQAENLAFFLNVFIPFVSDHASLLELDFLPDSMGLPETSRFDWELNALTGSLIFENLVLRRISAETDAKIYAERLLAISEELQRLLQAEVY